MRKMERWTAEEASTIYWLALWGCTNKDIRELAAPIITTRSIPAIEQMTIEIKKHLTIIKKLPHDFKKPKFPIEVFRKASKIPPVHEIKDLQPKDLSEVVFIPTIGKSHSSPAKHVSPKFEQRPEGYQKQTTALLNGIDKSQFLIQPQKTLSLAEVLQTAKEAGAKKVVWGDYVIKFR
jgi:hypothetical protein